MARKWSINGRFLGQAVTGVQRYASEVVRCIDEIIYRSGAGDGLEVELLCPPNADRELPLKAIRQRRVGHLTGHAWEQLALPVYVRGGLLSLCNTGPVTVRKQIVCIHDLNTRSYPQSYSRAFRAVYGTLLPALGRSARAIATVSHHSASELERQRICTRDKIFVAPNGHEHVLLWSDGEEVALPATVGRDTIVVMGSTTPHKNVGLIIGMAKKLEAAGLRIAVVGAIDSRVFSSAVLMDEAPNVDWLGRLSDRELDALLRRAHCLAFPSFVEGFGLPLLEAMTVGCPVVSSNTASMPEICGDAALYASPNNPEEWFENFMRLRRETGLREQMIMRGWARVRRFRWQATAQLYLDVMSRIDGVAATRDEAAARPVHLRTGDRHASLSQSPRS